MAKRIIPIQQDWQQILTFLKSDAFPNPWQCKIEENPFVKSVTKIAQKEDNMRFEKGSLIPYVVDGSHTGITGQGVPNFGDTKETEVNENPNNIDDVIDSLLSHLFTNMNNPTHPLTIPNILPPVTTASIVSSILSTKLNPNAIDSHYSVNVSKAELEVASMIAHLLPLGHDENTWPKPWAPQPLDSTLHVKVDSLPETGDGCGGITTFGGTGCYMYAVKYALTKLISSVQGNDTPRATGFDKGKFVILVSDQGHYCSSNVTDWLGIGYDQVIAVRTKKDNNMDLNDLKAKLDLCYNNSRVVIAVIATFGTTDAGALEDIKAVRHIVQAFDNIVDPQTNIPYGKPLIYSDSVIGWIWLFFRKYDFINNPLKFEQTVLDQIKVNAEKAKYLASTDVFGADFHKTGYSPYPASMVMIKNYGEFADLMKRDPPAYLQQEQYDPGLYTLETSRSSIGYVTAWSALKHLGLNGVRSLTYNLLLQTNNLRKKLRDTGFIVICNESNYSFSTLLRIYPQDDVNAREQFESELVDEGIYDQFKVINEFQRAIYERMLKHIRKNDGSSELLSTPNISLTTGYRKTYYNPDGDKNDPADGSPMEDVFALKCYLNTPFLNDAYLDLIVAHFRKVRDEVTKYYLLQNLTELFASETQIIRPQLRKGVHRYHNLTPAVHIPYRFLLPKIFDLEKDPQFTSCLKQIQKQIEDVKTKIAVHHKELALHVPN